MRLRLDPVRQKYFGQIPTKTARNYRVGQILDQGSTGTCFPAGTHVRMADGSERRIEDVRLLDDVLTAEGRIGRVMQTMVRMHEAGVVRLKLWGHSHLRMTAEHPVLTRRGYVPVASLTGDDYVALPRFALTTLTQLRTREFTHNPNSTRLKTGLRQSGSVQGRASVTTEVVTAPETLEMTVGAGRIFGLFLAEGSTSPHKVVWTFGAHERGTLVEELVGLLRSEWGAEGVVQLRGNNAINVNLFGTQWSRLFTRLCGTGAGRKRVHPLLSQGSSAFQRSLFEGWFAGDGHQNVKGRRDGVTVSHELALGMFDIAQAAGLNPAIRLSAPSQNRHAATRQMRWDLNIAGEGAKDSWRMASEPTCVWRRVRALEFEPFVGPVYNLHVSGDNSYVAEGVGVHNCVAHGWIGWCYGSPLMDVPGSLPTPFNFYRSVVLRDPYSDNDAEATAPDDGLQLGTDVRSGVEELRAMGRVKTYLHAESTEDLRLWHLLGWGGVVIGIDWQGGMMDTDRQGFVHCTGEVVGGHCVRSVGWSDTICPGGAMKIANSWGRGWGMSGLAWIRRMDLDVLMQRGGGEFVAAIEQKLAPVVV